MKRWHVMVILLCAVLLGAAAIWYFSQPAKSQQAASATDTQSTPTNIAASRSCPEIDTSRFTSKKLKVDVKADDVKDAPTLAGSPTSQNVKDETFEIELTKFGEGIKIDPSIPYWKYPSKTLEDATAAFITCFSSGGKADDYFALCDDPEAMRKSIISANYTIEKFENSYQNVREVRLLGKIKCGDIWIAVANFSIKSDPPDEWTTSGITFIESNGVYKRIVKPTTPLFIWLSQKKYLMKADLPATQAAIQIDTSKYLAKKLKVDVKAKDVKEALKFAGSPTSQNVKDETFEIEFIRFGDGIEIDPSIPYWKYPSKTPEAATAALMTCFSTGGKADDYFALCDDPEAMKKSIIRNGYTEERFENSYKNINRQYLMGKIKFEDTWFVVVKYELKVDDGGDPWWITGSTFIERDGCFKRAVTVDTPLRIWLSQNEYLMDKNAPDIAK